MAVGGRVRDLRRRGLDVVNLGGGLAEPVASCLAEPILFAPGRNVGGDPSGEPDLRAALANKLLRDLGLAWDAASEIVVTTGAKQALLPALLAVLEGGDEVLVLDPCWVTYAPAVRLAGGVPVPVSLRTDEGFRLDAGLLSKHVTSRTRAIILNTPHNPTGRVFTREELAGIAQLAVDQNLWVFSDESFDKFVFDGHRHVSIATLAGMKERSVVIQSFSKAFALAGARVGYLAAPASLCRSVIRFNEHVITCVSPMMQAVALAALAEEQAWTELLIARFEEKRRVAGQALASIPRLRFSPCEGTFYAFVDIRSYDASSQAFADRMIAEAGVAVTPGVVFGESAEGYVRINLAGSLTGIEEGLRRLQAAIG